MNAKETAGKDPAGPTLSAAQQKEIDLIKQTFKDKEGTLLKQVRALMLGVRLLPDEKQHIASVFSDGDLRAIFQRRFLPDIQDSRDTGLGQLSDIWLGAEQMIFGATAMQIEQGAKYKERAIALTRVALALLENPDGPVPAYKVSSYAEDPLQIELMARNMFIKHVDNQLLMMFMIANQEVETQKEKDERHIRNSTK